MKLELRSIRVKNCGPLDDVRVEFYDEQGKTLPVCVLAGANGSGKTTIVELIQWLMKGLFESVWSGKLYFQSGYAQLDLLVNGRAMSIAYGNNSDGDLPPDNVRFVWSDDDEPSLNKLVTGELAKKLLYEQEFWRGKLSEWESPGFALSNGQGYSAPTVLYFPHTRNLEPVKGAQVTKETLPYQFVHRFDVVRSFPGSLSSYLIWLDYAEPEQFKAAQEFLNELDFEGKTFHVQRKTLDIIVHTRDGQEHKLHELSSGEQNLLIILMELRRRLLPHSIVLIDEIENSLHPAYQHKLAQALLKMQQMIPFQLIVTTHSWEFAEIFGTSATRVLTKF